MNGMLDNYPPRIILVIFLENIAQTHNLRTMWANFILFQIPLTHPPPPTSQSYQMCFVKDTLPSI